MRGFDYDKLEAVSQVLLNHGARITDESPAAEPKPCEPLVPITHQGAPHYTIAALAAHYGRSPTTIRKKLDSLGLLREMVPLSATGNGGRPRRAFPASALPMVQSALSTGTPTDECFSEIDRRLAAVTGAAQAVEPPPVETTPTARPLPVRPAMTLVKGGRDDGFDDLAAQLNALVATTTKDLAPVAVRPAGDEAHHTTEAQLRERLETCRVGHVEQRAPLNREEAFEDLRLCNMEAEAAGLQHLVMDSAQMEALVDEWDKQWSDRRRTVESALNEMRQQLVADLTGRETRPSVAEIVAATTAFARAQAMPSEVDRLRDEIAGHYRMARAVASSPLDEVRRTQEYADALERFSAMAIGLPR